MNAFALILLLLSGFYSCKSQSLSAGSDESVSQILSRLNSRDTIDVLDFSHKNLKMLPDLSAYKVKKLNISYNDLDTLPMKNLPHYLVVLDASHNKIGKGLNFINVKWETKKIKNNVSRHLREVDLSYNKLVGVTFYLSNAGAEIDRIVLSNNNLERLELDFSKKISYLDISDNTKLSNEVAFDLELIQNIRHDNIANDKPLEFIKKKRVYIPDK